MHACPEWLLSLSLFLSSAAVVDTVAVAVGNVGVGGTAAVPVCRDQSCDDAQRE